MFSFSEISAIYFSQIQARKTEFLMVENVTILLLFLKLLSVHKLHFSNVLDVFFVAPWTVEEMKPRLVTNPNSRHFKSIQNTPLGVVEGIWWKA